jgi:hypothetical protein
MNWTVVRQRKGIVRRSFLWNVTTKQRSLVGELFTVCVFVASPDSLILRGTQSRTICAVRIDEPEWTVSFPSHCHRSLKVAFQNPDPFILVPNIAHEPSHWSS